MFWKEIKKSKPEEPVRKLNFHDHFSRLASGESKLGEEGVEEVGEESRRGELDSVNEVIDRPITMEELDNTIKMLKTNTSPGHDQIINEFLVNA